MSDDSNDSDVTMGKISRGHGKSIIDLLIDIQNHQIEQRKLLPLVENLECLKTDSRQRTRLSRELVDAFDNPRYVALSYTWDESDYEDPSSGRYQVQSRKRFGNNFDSSEVRNCVFDRILKYMDNFKVKFLWIDSHSLQQSICEEVDCKHLECNENREGLDVMDLVYKLSAHPVALLSTPIESQSHLNLLTRILSGDLVSHDQKSMTFQFSKQTSRRETVRAIMLLRKLTQDRWWTRGWIFQESYRAGRALRLLVPHSSDLESFKLSLGAKLFSNIRGELCINATSFSYEATRLCLAFRGMESPPPRVRKAISQIIATAGRYTLTLGNNVSMSPQILSDIGKRDLKRHWDQLAIAANCCQYSTRLDVQELKHKKHSFSLSKLALFLLNGELLCNSKLPDVSPGMTVLEFLSSQAFKGFYAPLGQGNLSFNKGCRLNDVKFTRNGILTKGHLWKLGRTIHSHEIKQQPSWVDDPRGRLGLRSRKRLAQLANTLEHFDYRVLANNIWDYLNRDAANEARHGSSETFASSYMRMMASELVNAIDLDMTFRLACILETPQKTSPYLAIFICKDEATLSRPGRQHRVPRDSSSMVFTSSAPRIQRNTDHESNDLDRHVSLEVRQVGFIAKPGGRGSIPRLEIKSWILGLCFFEGIGRSDIIFPWPPGLETIAS